MSSLERGALFGRSSVVAVASVALLSCALALAGCKRRPRNDDEGTTAAATTAAATPPPPAATPAAPPVQTAAAPVPAPAPAPVGGPLRRAGDRVNVRWKGKCYAARILSVPKPGAYFITYEGYNHSWDETVGETRICK